MAAAAANAQVPANIAQLKDSNHFSEGMALGTSDQQLGGPLLQWIRALPKG